MRCRSANVPRLRVLAAVLAFAALASACQAQAVTATALAITSGGHPVTTVSSGTVVTLTATVLAGATPVTPGLVKFCDASAAHCEDIHILGSAQLTSAGTAAIKFRPAIGAHSYKAVFVGTTTDMGSASGAASLTVTGLYPTQTGIVQSLGVGNYTLTAVVGSISSLPPTGTVSFLDTSHGNAVLGTAPLGAGMAGLSFLNPSGPAVSQNMDSVAVGDFNGDGIPDLAVANFGNANITVLLGNGDGTFTAAATSPATGNGPIAVAVGDFNGDGKLDMAVANYTDGTVTILLGNGDGSFTATASPVHTGTNPDGIAVGNFNGDGNLDLAVANYGGNNVSILLGDGTGKFAVAGTSPATGSKPSSIVTGDFNGDGVPDLAVANYGSNNVTVLTGNGDGTFTAVATSPGTGTEPNSILVGDFLGNGKADLAVANINSNSVTVLLGNGNGTFTAAASPATGFDPYSIAIGDFNGDGIPDLAVANYGSNTVTVLLGNGDGTFTASMTSPPTSNNPYAIAAGDFNGEGKSDIAVANYYDVTVTVLLAAGTEVATATVNGIAPIGAGTHLVEADYPGDSLNSSSVSGTTALSGQIATATTLSVSSAGNPVTTVAWGTAVKLTAAVTAGGSPVTTGRVNFCDATETSCADLHLLGSAQLTSAGTAAIKLVPAVGIHSYKAVFSGITGGNALSTTSTSSTESLTVTGTFPTTTTIAESGNVGNYTLTATVTGAGSTEPSGTVSFLDISDSNAELGTATLAASTGSLSFFNSSNPAVGGVGEPDGVAVADFNADGILDLAVANPCCNTVTILLGNGDGTFTPTTASPATGASPSYIAVADFNGDGIPDLAVGSSPVTVLLGNGDGTFRAAPTPSTATGIKPDHIFAGGGLPIAMGDFNGDGIPDLAIANSGGNTVTVLLGNGDGTFTAAASPVVSSDPSSIVVADFNRDGVLDLAVVNFDIGEVTVLLGNGDGTFTASPSSPVTGGWAASMVVGDFNGDGIPDLAVAVYTNYEGYVSVLLGNGDGTFTVTSTSPPTGHQPNSIAMGDFNGDGNLDLATSNRGDYTVSVLLGDGHGNFTPTATSPPTGPTPEFVASGDFNHDGITDLVTVNENLGNATVLLAENQSATATANGISPVGTGTHQVDASYGGDSNFSSSSSGAVGLTAQLLPPRMTLAASSDAVSSGTKVTFTVTVKENAPPPQNHASSNTSPITPFSLKPPTGYVTFLNGKTAMGSGTLNSSGVATFATDYLPTGSDSITASYSGDSNFKPATSSPVSVTVTGKPTPTVNLTSSASSSTYGSPVTLTATLAGSGSKPTGSVTFLDGATQLGTGALNSSGVATCSTTALKPGLHSLTATYSGNGSYSVAISTAVSLTVSQDSPAITWATPAAIAYGTALSSTQLDAKAPVAGTFSYSPPAGTVLSPGQHTLTAKFTPENTTDYKTATKSVTLTVNKATPTITWATPATITYGTKLSAAKLDATADVAGTFVYSPAAGTVLPAGLNTLTVTFTPTNTADYIKTTAKLSLLVLKATPAITWARPADIAYGTPLSATQLDAKANVPGTFVYSPAAGAVLPIGANTLTVTFTPANTTDYTTATDKTGIWVSPATPAITWKTPANITYGTALTATQLDATANAPGTFVYSPAAGTVLSPGSKTLIATFTPANTADYVKTTAKVSLLVLKATPTITWAKPANITYGTALSATQLDATANVPGTFVYSPAAGAVLSAGANTLTVTFTPTNTADYNTAKATLGIWVYQAAPAITWPTPAPITAGTPLSATQLDAAVTGVDGKVLAGTSTYSPAAGTVLASGKHILTVTFTPTDSSDYKKATASVTLTVQ